MFQRSARKLCVLVALANSTITMVLLRLGQACIYSMNIFPITFFYFLLYPTIDSTLASHYLDYSFIMVSSSYSKLRLII